jgi:hypothetical protein
MSRHDIINELAAINPVPTEILARNVDPNAERLREEILRQSPMQRPRTSRLVPSMSQRLVLVSAAAGVAGLVATSVVWVANQPATTAPPEASQSLTQGPATTRQILLAAAEKVEQSEETSGRYWVEKTEHGGLRQVGPADARYEILERRHSENWEPTNPKDQTVFLEKYLGAAPATPADEAAWKADGSPTRWIEKIPDLPDPIVIEAAAGPVGGRSVPGSQAGRPGMPEPDFSVDGTPMSRAELAALPTDPAALKAALLKARAENGSVTTGKEYSFWSVKELVFDLPVAPQVRAAAYRLMADLDEVTVLGPVKDRHGRAGVAISYDRRGDGGNVVQTRLIIDPQTGQPLAEESWDLGKDGSSETLSNYEVILSAGWSDEAPPKEFAPLKKR